MSTSPTCARHPDVETRLSCSACGTPICPDCGREAAVGFKCPDCSAHEEATTSGRSSGSRTSFSLPGAGHSRSPSSGSQELSAGVAVRAVLVGIAASVVGGAILWPVLQEGMFFLLSAGVIGWGVARAVYWATEEHNSPAIRAGALALAGFSVAVAMGLAGVGTGRGALVFLAYPAAIYGAWIVVRQR